MRNTSPQLRNLARSVTSGDVNGDGFSDVLVASQSVADGRCQLATYLGGPDGLSAAPSNAVVQEDALQSFSIGARDLDGDGFDDVVFHTLSRDRGAMLYFGSAMGLLGTRRIDIGPITGFASISITPIDRRGTSSSGELGVFTHDGTTLLIRRVAVSPSRDLTAVGDLRPEMSGAQFGRGLASSR